MGHLATSGQLTLGGLLIAGRPQKSDGSAGPGGCTGDEPAHEIVRDAIPTARQTERTISPQPSRRSKPCKSVVVDFERLVSADG